VATLTNNQNIKLIRDIVRDSFDRLGGADWLVTFAQANWENARVYVSLVGRLMPTEIVGKGGGDLTIIIKKEGSEGMELGRLINGVAVAIEDKTLQ
jgi:hypothetical protein